MWTNNLNARRKSVGSFLRHLVVRGVIILMLLLLWYWLGLRWKTLQLGPLDVFAALCDIVRSGELLTHVVNSLHRVVVGFGAAAIVGYFAGTVLGRFKAAGWDFAWIMEILRPIPPIAWIPVAILMFGLGDPSAYFVVFLGSVFPIFTNVFVGISEMPIIYQRVASTFEIGNWRYFRWVLVPYSLSHYFTGLRIGLGMAWMSVIAAELIGAQDGLGYFIQMSRLLLQIDRVILGMILIGCVGLLLSTALCILERIVTPWRFVKG